MERAANGLAARRWYHGWNIVAVCVLSQAVGLGLSTNCFSLFLDKWSHEFGAPISTLASAVTLLSVLIALVVPFAGHYADKLSARWLFGTALAGLVVFHAAVGFTTAGWQIVTLYAVVLPLAMGFSGAVPAQTVVCRWFKRRIGFAMGLTGFGIAVAGVVMPPVVGWLMPLVGWRGTWWLYAGVIALIAVPLVVGVLRDKPDPDEGLVEGFDRDARPATIADVPAIPILDIFRRRNFWITLGVVFPLQCAWMGASINLAPIVLRHGFDVVTAGALLSLLNGAAVSAKLVSGLLADRMGNRLPLVLMALLCAAGTVILALGAGNLLLLSVSIVLIGFSGGNWVLLASATAAEFGPQAFGRAFGMICAFTSLGAIAPPVIARLEEIGASYVAGLVGLGVLALVGAGIALFLKETRSQSLDDIGDDAAVAAIVEPAVQ